jgi:hypothetical protein
MQPSGGFFEVSVRRKLKEITDPERLSSLEGNLPYRVNPANADMLYHHAAKRSKASKQ